MLPLHDFARRTRRATWGIWVAALWLPTAASYGLLLVMYMDWSTDAAIFALLSIATSSTLAFPVWRLTGRVPWPATKRERFFAVHLLAAVAFAVGWLLLDTAAARLLIPANTARKQATAMGWEALLGAWLYGLFASVSYAARAQASLSEQRRVAAEASAAAAHARLHALSVRLTPHFLLNALHGIATVALYRPHEVDASLDRLGALLRRAIAADSSDTVMFADDVDFAREYLAIEAMRLGDRLRAVWDIDEAALECTVPTLMLQPLIENAIRYGIEPRAAGATLRVEAHVAADVLTVVVTDSGVGASPAQVQAASGVGLAALRERLQLRGGECAVDVSTAPGAGFRVCVTIPDGK